MRISDWSSDLCSSDLDQEQPRCLVHAPGRRARAAGDGVVALELRNVSKRVGAEEHIGDVSLTLEKGSLNVLLGPTLSGKTSLMRLMAGLDRPTERSEEHTSELQSLMRNSYAVFC